MKLCSNVEKLKEKRRKELFSLLSLLIMEKNVSQNLPEFFLCLMGQNYVT